MSIRTTIVKLLDEVDEDIKNELLLREGRLNEFEKWELLPDPANTILNWQSMRDHKKI